MNINVDLSFLPVHLVPIITNSIEIKSFLVKNDDTNSQGSNTKTYTFEFPGSLIEFKATLNYILKENSIDDYIVVQDTEKENTLTILKEGDIEQLGVLICDFCGAVFHSEDEKYIHQRMHYFF